MFTILIQQIKRGGDIHEIYQAFNNPEDALEAYNQAYAASFGTDTTYIGLHSGTNNKIRHRWGKYREYATREVIPANEICNWCRKEKDRDCSCSWVCSWCHQPAHRGGSSCPALPAYVYTPRGS